MNNNKFREFGTFALIVLAVCVGAWMLLVKPKADEISKIQQTIAEQKQAAANPMNQQVIEEAAKRTQTMKARLAEVTSCNTLANDSSHLYGLIMDSADAHGIHVQSLQPSGAKQTIEEGNFESVRLIMSVDGPFEKVAEFFESVCTLNAFIRPVKLQLIPSQLPGQTTVEANFECDVLSFGLTSALADMGGSTNGHP